MGLFDLFLSEDTKNRLDEAKELNESAESMVDDARNDFEKAQDSCKKVIKKLDISKQKIYKGTMAMFAISITKIHSANFSIPKELQELSKYTDGTDFFYPYVDINSGMWESSLGRDVATLVSVFSFGAIGGLAWRSYMKKKSKIALDNAHSTYAQAEVVEEQLILATEVCSYVCERAKIFDEILQKLNKMFLPLVRSMETIIKQKGIEYSDYSVHEQQTIAAAVSTALSIKSILDVAIINKDGSLSLESKQLAINMSSKLQLECNADALGDKVCLPVDEDYELVGGLSDNKLIYCDTYDKIVRIISLELKKDRTDINMYTTLSELGATDVNVISIKQKIENKLEIHISNKSINKESSIEDIVDVAVNNLDDTFKDIKYLAGKALQSETAKNFINGAKSFFDIMRDS